jgi:hypothetical protein
LALERSMLLKKLLMRHWILLKKRLKTLLRMLLSWLRSMLLMMLLTPLLRPLLTLLLMQPLKLLDSLHSLLSVVLFD